jgi:curved DNA-binding protein CbpA
MKDYYGILGVAPDAQQEQIRERYRRAVISCHPDKFLDLEQKRLAEEKIKELNEAYAVLSDPTQRAAYDCQIARRSEKRRQRVASARRPSPRSVQAAWNSPVTPVDDWVSRPVTNWGEVEHLHYSFFAFRGDRLEVELDRPANVILLDGLNYNRYRIGTGFHYLGGFSQGSPARLLIPVSGDWHLVIDQGGYPAALRAAVRLMHETY